jgi:hypothetical protein
MSTFRDSTNLLGPLRFAILMVPTLAIAGTTVQGTGTGGPIPSGAFVTSGVVTSDIVLSAPGYVAQGNAVTVTLLGLQHDFSGDLHITLSYINSSGTTLQSVDLINRLGATSANPYGTAADFGNDQGVGDNYLFNTDYTGNIWAVAACADPPNCTEPYGDADSIPGVSTDTVNFGQYFTSTTAGAKTNLSYSFTGFSVSGGTWRLTITDAADPNVGSYIGWQISVITVPSPPPFAITAVAGSPQSATISTSFASALQAKVTDVYSNPISGVTVTFAAPSTAASATFSGSSSVAATTNSSGIAVSPIPVANATAGSYTVTASVTGVTSASFSLTNSAVVSGSPQVKLSPTSLNFGTQTVSTTASQTITVTNSGTAALSVNSVQLSGTNSTDFTATNGCTSSVAPNATCTITVNFDPAATGSRSASLSISDNAGGSPQTVALSGTGSTATTPTTFTTYLGTYGSGFQTISGNSVLLPLRGYIPGGASQMKSLIAWLATTASGALDYQITAQSDGAGGYTLRMCNGSYTVTQPLYPYLEMSLSGTTVTLSTPITVGTLSITAYRLALVGNEFQLDLSVTRSGTFSDQVVILGEAASSSSSPWDVSDGEWYASSSAAPAVTLSPTSLNFGTQTVGTTASQTITVTNSGTAALSIGSVQLSGTNSADFTATNGCTSSVAPNATCTITVTFDPAATGSRSASLSISDNASGSPQTVALSGTGSTAATPNTFTTYLGTYGSGFQTISGNSVLLPLRGYIPGGASQMGSLIVWLATTASGALDYQITAQSDGAGGYTLRMCNGSYTVTEPLYPYLEMSLSGTTVTLSTPITVGSLSITAYRLALVGNEFQLDLSVTRSGTFSDQVVILGEAASSSSSPWDVSDGEWYASSSAAPAVTLSPTSLNFGTQTVGATASQTITVTNSGTAALSISSVQLGGTNSTDFTETNNCISSVAPNATCTITVTFDPAATGSRTALLSITDNATGSPQTVALSGTGSTAATPTTFTTYLGTYGTGFQTLDGNSTLLPLRGYIPGGASQMGSLIVWLTTTASGALDYQITAQSDGAGGYTLSVTRVVPAAFGSRRTAPASSQSGPSATGIGCTSCGCLRPHSDNSAFARFRACRLIRRPAPAAIGSCHACGQSIDWKGTSGTYCRAPCRLLLSCCPAWTPGTHTG